MPGNIGGRTKIYKNHQTCTSNRLKMMKHDGKIWKNLGRDMAKFDPRPGSWSLRISEDVTNHSHVDLWSKGPCLLQQRSIEINRTCKLSPVLGESLRIFWTASLHGFWSGLSESSSFSLPFRSSWPMEMFSILIGWKSNSISSLKRNGCVWK